MILPVYSPTEASDKVIGFLDSEHIVSVIWEYEGIEADGSETMWRVRTARLASGHANIYLTPYLVTEAEAIEYARQIMDARFAEPMLVTGGGPSSSTTEALNNALNRVGREVQRELSPKETAVLAACGSPNRPTTDALARILHCQPDQVDGHIVIRRLVSAGRIEAYQAVDDNRVHWRMVAL